MIEIQHGKASETADFDEISQKTAYFATKDDELDTREKLWTDCKDLIRRIRYRFFSVRDETALRDQFAELLDRQAAITERECRSLSEPYEDAAARTIGDLRAALDGTTAERNRARSELDCARAELDRWRDRAMRAESKGDTQKLNSLRNTLRRDWHTETVWCDAQSVYSLRVDPDVLRPIPNFTRNEVYRESLAELDALQAKVDELQARFDDFEGDCYRGATVVQWYEHSVLLQGKLDEMERTHMLLPVDADGVPIRIGDLLEHVDIDGYEERFTVMGYTRMPDSVTFMATNGVSAEFYCDQCRHVQQDTVESLLEEFQQDTLTTQGEYAGEVIDADKWKRDLKEHIEDYAERIRKVVKQ